ncbi:MAG: CDP-alcohol phosphatidyltransferase family protein [Candidatus Altiarchaeales archaeon]|nr:CDP-alcohol phosphatidyltransferase family protein [Candidatus Altiarchaeales archaeon]
MLKSRFNTEYISVKIGIVFSKLGISPNIWTLFALIPALGGFAALLHGELLYGFILFFISGFIDAIDGAVARVTGSVTAKGAFLDGIIDRYVEILLYMGLLFYLLDKDAEFLSIHSSVWVTLLIFGAMMPSFVTAYADHRKVVTKAQEHRRMAGFLERAERLILLYVGMILGYFNDPWLVYMIVLTGLLANITAIQRIWFVLKFRE